MYGITAYAIVRIRYEVDLVLLVIYTTDSLTAASLSTSLSHGAVVAGVASSVTVFILCSVLFFIIGYVCGYFGQKHKQSSACKETSDEIVRPQQSQPVYEDVLPKSTQEDHFQIHDFELKKNVAYGPAHSSCT